MDEHRHIGAKQSRGNKRTTHDNGDLHHCEHPPLRDARHGRSLVGITKCGKADGGVLTVLAAASVLNLKGKEIQGEPNPYSIRRAKGSSRT